jgi:hypothetical protein
VLKNPGHLGSIEALLELFPKALFVQTERNIGDTLGSYCGMMEEIYAQSFVSVDPLSIGEQAREYWGYELSRFRQSRVTLGPHLPLIEVDYVELVNDTMSVISRIYDARGLVLTQQARQAMEQWERDNRQHKFGKFDYSLSRFGLTPAKLRETFGF